MWFSRFEDVQEVIEDVLDRGGCTGCFVVCVALAGIIVGAIWLVQK